MDVPTLDVVREKDFAILRVNDGKFVISHVTPSGFGRLSNRYKKVSLAPLVGAPWGSFWEVKAGALERCVDPKARGQLFDGILQNEPSEELRDNRNLNDDASSQKLSTQDIEDMKKAGHDGQSIIQALVESSTTFQNKTEYGKEKYLKKKKEKYLCIVEVIQPSALTLAKAYFLKNRQKICALRIDSLSQILTKTNIHSLNKPVLVSETCSGLVVGTLAERMYGSGVLVNVHSKGSPVIPLVNFFNFSEQQNSIIHSLSFQNLSDLLSKGSYQQPDDGFTISTTDPQRRIQLLNAREVRQQAFVAHQKLILETIGGGFDALVIAVDRNHTNVFQSLFPLLNPGQSFCVYCEYIQPLIVIHEAMKRSDSAVGLDITETWMREYQVLPNRTHPLNQITGASGYLLHGIKTKSTFGKDFIHTFVAKQESTKRAKVALPEQPEESNPIGTKEEKMDIEL